MRERFTKEDEVVLGFNKSDGTTQFSKGVHLSPVGSNLTLPLLIVEKKCKQIHTYNNVCSKIYA